MAYDFSGMQKKIDQTKIWLQQEFQSLRTGRASPTLLDGVMVDAYGSRMPLIQVAQVGIEDSRTLRVSAYDPSLLKDIERGIVSANLGVGTSVSDSVRVIFPELTTERRGELVKVAKSKLEEARVAIKGIRNETSDDIESKEEEGGMGEDDKFRFKDEMQKLIDKANKDLEDAFKKKEEDIMNI